MVSERVSPAELPNVPRLRSEYLIKRHGKNVVLVDGLVALAHDAGVQSMETFLIQAPSAGNDTAIFKARVCLADGRVFEAHGDASPNNVSKQVVPHFIRMAETRAIGRALRRALNIDAVTAEELGDDVGGGAPEAIERRDQPVNPLPRLRAELTRQRNTHDAENMMKPEDQAKLIADLGAAVGDRQVAPVLSAICARPFSKGKNIALTVAEGRTLWCWMVDKIEPGLTFRESARALVAALFS